MVDPATVITNFDARDDLAQYGTNALLLFALELRFALDDIDATAATALTDGPDDKSCDLVYIDGENGVVVVAQGYHASAPKPAAPSKKASDLNQALTWLIATPLAERSE